MEETVRKIKRLVGQVEKFRRCDLWERDLGNSEFRAWYCAKESVPRFEWAEGGDRYSAEFVVEMPTCRECRTRGIYYRNGIKTTLKAVNGSLRRMEAQINA